MTKTLGSLALLGLLALGVPLQAAGPHSSRGGRSFSRTSGFSGYRGHFSVAYSGLRRTGYGSGSSYSRGANYAHASNFRYYRAGWFLGRYYPSGYYASINGRWFLRGLGYCGGYNSVNACNSACQSYNLGFGTGCTTGCPSGCSGTSGSVIVPPPMTTIPADGLTSEEREAVRALLHQIRTAPVPK